MFKRISLLISLITAFMWTGTAFAQPSASIPTPSSFTRINFISGTSVYTFTTNLTSGVSLGYVLYISAPRSIYITESGNANLEMLDPQGNILLAPTTLPGPRATGTVQTGDHELILYGQGPVTISIYIPQGYYSQPFSTIVPPYPSRINFAPGAVSTSFGVTLNQGQPLAFVLGISTGQQLNVWTQGNITATVLDLYGSPLSASSTQYGQWQYNIPLTGDYTLVLSGWGPGWISITIPAFGTSPAPSYPIRIRFAPGNASYSTTTYQPYGSSATSYLLGISSGQTLYIATTGNVSSVQVFDPLGNSVPSWAQANGSLAFHIARTGDYRVVVYGTGLIGITFYIPPLWWW